MQRDLVEIGECTLEVRRYGEGEPVIVLPGEEGALFLEPFLSALATTHETIVPIHPSWGRSTRPNYVKTARDVALVEQELIERLGRAVPVVGLSFGGWIAAEIASIAPSLVPTLVLVSPTGVKVGGREDRDFHDIYLTEPGARRDPFYAPGKRPELKEIDGEDIYLEIAKAEDAVARFCWKPYMHDPDLRHRLRRIRAETLVISGSEDRFVLNPTYFETYASWIGGGAEHRRVLGAGHRVEEEHPDLVADAVRAFIAQRVPSNAGH